MTTMNNDYRFRCLKNGRPMTLPFKEALSLLWACNIGWVRPIEWLRYSIDGHVDGVFLGQKKVADAGRFFGYHLLTRGYHVLTIDRYAELRECDMISADVFHAHAARFNKAFDGLPDALRPFEFIRCVEDKPYGLPGYRLRPPLTCCLILGVDVTCGVHNEQVDWDAFRQPPQDNE